MAAWAGETNVIHAVLVNVSVQSSNWARVNGLSGLRPRGSPVAGVAVPSIAHLAVHKVVGDCPIQEEPIRSDGLTRERIDGMHLLQCGIDTIQIICLVGDQRFCS